MAKFAADQVAFLRAVKGAPASILLALALTGASLTNQELQLATGYSDKPVTQGLAMLELQGFVQNNGHAYGWSLPHGRQLPLFPAALLGRESEDPLPRSASLGSGPQLSRSASLGSGAGPVDNPVDNSPGEAADVRNISECSEYLRTSALTTTTTTDPSEEEVAVVAAKQPENRKISELQAQKGEILEMLVEAGVGRRSAKLRQLLQLDLDPEHVRAFVLEKRAQGYDPGLLIHKLLEGDPPPAPRCETCLEPLPCYCGLVRR